MSPKLARSLAVATIAICTVAATPRSAGATTFTIDPGIPSDCSTDVTTAVNQFIASIPDGTIDAPNTGLFQPDGCYLINSGRVKVVSKAWITLDGQGATFKRTIYNTSNLPIWGTTDGKRITLANIAVVGTGSNPPSYVPSKVYEHGIKGDNTKYLTVRDSSITNVWGDCITFFPGSANASAINNWCRAAGRQGISVIQAIGVNISGGNDIKNVHFNDIDLEPDVNVQTIQDVVIDGNKLGYSTAMVGYPIAISGCGTNNITVSNNTLTAVGNLTVWAYAPSGCTHTGLSILGNTMSANGVGNRAVIDLTRHNGGVSIASNSLSLRSANPTMPSYAQLTDSQDVSWVTDNTVSHPAIPLIIGDASSSWQFVSP